MCEKPVRPERLQFLKDVQFLAEQSVFPMPPEYSKTNATLVLYMLEKIWRAEGREAVWEILRTNYLGSRCEPHIEHDFPQVSLPEPSDEESTE
jgi:hypothetical protein